MGNFAYFFVCVFLLGSLRRTQTYRTGKEKSFVLSLFLSWTQMRAWDKHPASFSSRSKRRGRKWTIQGEKKFFERNWRLFPFSFFCTAVTDAFKLPHTKGEKQDSCYTYWPQWGCPSNKYEKRNAASLFSCHHHAKSALIRLQRRKQKNPFCVLFLGDSQSFSSSLLARIKLERRGGLDSRERKKRGGGRLKQTPQQQRWRRDVGSRSSGGKREKIDVKFANLQNCKIATNLVNVQYNKQRKKISVGKQ